MQAKYSGAQIAAAVNALKNFSEKPFVKHQWEEVVLFLSQSDDPFMRERMKGEMELIRTKCPGLLALKDL